jgi:hypothetical protein
VRFLLALLIGLAASPQAQAEPAPGDAVTAGSLLAHERYWPYHVSLLQDWKPAGTGQPLRKGTRGVLIRLESAELTRIDFGRWGLHEVPIPATDLVANANRIRLGELAKPGPNFLVAIGRFLLDPAAPKLDSYSVDRALPHRAFLCAFADPDAKSFADLAGELAPLRGRADLLAIFFPQTTKNDVDTAAALRSSGWTAPFVFGSFSEAYARTLLPANAKLPALLLQTGEGRLLYAGAWEKGSAPKVLAALDAAFPEETAIRAINAGGRGSP